MSRPSSSDSEDKETKEVKEEKDERYKEKTVDNMRNQLQSVGNFSF